VNEIKTWYLKLPDDKKQVFLAIVAHQLTIHARYVVHEFSGEQQTAALKGLNELQHQISSHVAAIGLAAERYPDDVLWDILEEKAVQYQVSPELAQSIQFARSRSCWAKIM
jgi:hypothetical protein